MIRQARTKDASEALTSVVRDGQNEVVQVRTIHVARGASQGEVGCQSRVRSLDVGSFVARAHGEWIGRIVFCSQSRS